MENYFCCLEVQIARVELKAQPDTLYVTVKHMVLASNNYRQQTTIVDSN